MRNPFTQETRELFRYNHACAWCGMNQPDALHHIMGRVSSSPLNASPIHNRKCHIGNGTLENDESRSMLLKWTLEYLHNDGYKFTEEDEEFYEKYKRLYE